MNYQDPERNTSGCCIVRACHARIFNVPRFFFFVVVVLFFVEADNMRGDASTYFALVYWRREPVLVMKRVKRQAMFRPSWKFEGKPNSIPPQFFVLCFRVFLGGLRFRGLRFLGGLRFRGLRFLGGLRFRILRFLGGSSFSRSSFSRGSSFSRSLVFGLWSSFSRHPVTKSCREKNLSVPRFT